MEVFQIFHTAGGGVSAPFSLLFPSPARVYAMSIKLLNTPLKNMQNLVRAALLIG